MAILKRWILDKNGNQIAPMTTVDQIVTTEGEQEKPFSEDYDEFKEEFEELKSETITTDGGKIGGDDFIQLSPLGITGDTNSTLEKFDTVSGTHLKGDDICVQDVYTFRICKRNEKENVLFEGNTKFTDDAYFNSIYLNNKKIDTLFLSSRGGKIADDEESFDLYPNGIQGNKNTFISDFYSVESNRMICDELNAQGIYGDTIRSYKEDWITVEDRMVFNKRPEYKGDAMYFGYSTTADNVEIEPGGDSIITIDICDEDDIYTYKYIYPVLKGISPMDESVGTVTIVNGNIKVHNNNIDKSFTVTVWGDFDIV